MKSCGLNLIAAITCPTTAALEVRITVDIGVDAGFIADHSIVLAAAVASRTHKELHVILYICRNIHTPFSSL